MDNMSWGLQMMGVGMGVVFGLLVVLMGLLILIGLLDRPSPAPVAVERAPEKLTLSPSAEGCATVDIDSSGFTADTIAAIATAVMTHAENRRRLAAPEVRAAEPGSQLFASRWISIGRGNQTQPFRRK